MTDKATASGHQLITRERKGAKGDSAVTYPITAEPTCVIIGKDGASKTSTLKITGYIKTGSGTPTALTNNIAIVVNGSGGHIYNGQSPFTVDLTDDDFKQDLDSGAYSFHCQLKDTDGNTVLSTLDIPITRDGEDGRSIQSVDVVYQRSTSNSEEPTTWVTNAPKLPKGYYLWSANKITYKKNDGSTSTETVGAQCIASADNLKTATERYAQITSRTTPPANDSSDWKEGDTSGVAAKDGYYTWTQTKLTWDDGSVTYTDPICITGDQGATGASSPTVVIDTAAITHKKDKAESWTVHIRVKDGNSFVGNSNFTVSMTLPSNLTEQLVFDISDGEYITKAFSTDANSEVTGQITIKTTYKNVVHTNYLSVTTVKDGDPGTAVTAQFSSNKSSWHSSFTTGDVWMRLSNDGGTTWGEAMRVVGEKGDGGAWTDYSFNISSAETTSSPTTEPTPLANTAWQDAPIETTTTYPYLWMRIQKYSDESTSSGVATYVRITGEKGEKGERGETGAQGDKGDTGIQGCILRTSEWVSGMEYHNDEELTSGTRILDIAIVTESATSFHAFKCLKTHTASSTNAPQTGTTTEEWQPLNDLAPIYTPLIMAQYALLRLTQTNQLLVMKADGRTVNAGMGGGDYPLWVGAATPADAPFHVDTSGRMYAQGATIEGSINAKLISTAVKYITTTSYTVDPDNDPANVFVYNEALGECFFYLPSPSTYDGLEINIFIPTPYPATRTLYDLTVHVGCTNKSDLLLAKENTATVNSVQVEKIGGDVRFDNYGTDSIALLWGEYYTFKAMGGRWWAIRGRFSGE